MTERMIGIDEAVAVAEAPVLPEITPTKTEKATIKFCLDDGKDWHPVEVPEDFTVQDLKRATGSPYVSELQFDTVINRHKERESGPISPHHVYEILPCREAKMEAFLDKYGLYR